MSVPVLTDFDPRTIKWQYDALKAVRKKLDYTKGVQQVLLSGAVGSAKSALLTHIVVTHCLLNPGAVVGIGRLAMPRLKETLLRNILEHMSGVMKFKHNKATGLIELPNGSRIVPFSWADKNYKKVRSYEFSLFAIEELTETDDSEMYKEILMRMRHNMPEKLVISATNPDEPDHWVYKEIIANADRDDVHVFYSVTEDNPFLPDGYIEQLRENLSEQLCERMIYGRWLSITGEGVYHAYDPENNFINDGYNVVSGHPIHITFDFNIGYGKPMSCCAFQFINGAFHVFDEWIVEGANTEQLLNEVVSSGFLDRRARYIIHGDATGHSRSTNATQSDYDIIQRVFATHRTKDGRAVHYEKRVGRSNPPLRERHNLVNTYLKNANGKIRLFVYKDCPTVHEALMMTKLKKGSSYIEDDSKYYQHVGTALGYGVVHCHKYYSGTQDRVIKLY